MASMRAQGAHHRRAPGAGVREVAVLELRAAVVGRQVEQREDDVALRAVVVDAHAAPHRRGAALGGAPGEADPRHEGVGRPVEAAWRAGRHGEHARQGGARHPELLLLWHALARASDPAVGVTAARDHVAGARVQPHRARRVVERRVEVRHVVGLRVDGQVVEVAHAHLHAEPPAGLPVVEDEGLDLGEAEEAHRIALGLAVGAEVAEQGVGEGVAGGVRVPGGVEAHRACVVGAAVLVLAVADHRHAPLEQVGPADVGEGVGEGDVGGGREQGA